MTMHRPHQLRILGTFSVLLCAVLLFAGCEDEELLPPETADPIFDRYVALGNSITAGFQSGGINASTQAEAYPVFLAEAMETTFNVPLLNTPGCPPPLENPFTGERISDVPCALRARDVPPVVNNVAVPGARVIDLLDNMAPTASPTALTTFLLGGRTQLEAAADVQPTFASVWTGNNDVLAAAVSGDPSLITPAATFEAQYRQVLDSLEAYGTEGGLLIGVADVTLVPHLSPGAAYAQAQPAIQAMLQGSGGEFFVADNCAGEGASSLVPFSYGFGVLLARAQNGLAVQLDCLNDPPVLTPQETATVATAVQEYNAVIQSEAEARGWAYVDPNVLLRELQEEGAIPPFPDVQNPQQPFGPYVSLDGIHPSGAAHLRFANLAADAINATYGTDLPPIQ